MLTVSRPSGMWSSVASVRASMIGCISPQRTAASMSMSSAICGAATKLRVSCPTWQDEGQRMSREPSRSARSITFEVCSRLLRQSPSGTPR